MHVHSRRAPRAFRPAHVRSAVLVALSLVATTPAFASFVFTPGNLVVGLVGNVDGSGPYADNQATPVKLQELTTSGTPVQSLLLPQSASTSQGRAQSAFSGEYGSSSEGLLHLSADGHSLVIAGYGINAATFNTGGAATYGDARLAQSTSLSTAPNAVARVIADITATGVVDTSTALYNVFNGNNPRSVATVDGKSFYIAGQGLSKTDTATQGVFYAQLGAGSAVQVTGASDYRSVEIANGQLYASRDFNGTGVKATEIDRFSTALPTAGSTPTPLPGIGPQINVLTAGQANNVDTSRIGNNVYLSPEDYFFATDANSNQFLYIADSGNPKNGTVGSAQLGDGGLQKWELINGTWMLLYDIYSGLGIVSNANGTVAKTSGTSGLIGLAGKVVNGVTYLYATNSTLGDLDPTYVFSVMDPLSQLSLSMTNGNDVFATIFTAPTGTNVRGIAFAPVPEPGTLALAAVGMLGLFGVRRRSR